jgi:hypothetical protein
LHIKSIDAPNDVLKRQAMAKLYFDGGEYNLPLQQMEAGQSAEVDIKKLRDDKVKDVLGNVIPPNVTGGQLAWYGKANNGDFIGRLVQYNPVLGTSSSFSCVQNCICNPGFISSFLTPDFIGGSIGQQSTLGALETDADCNGDNQFTFGPNNPQFFSSNPDVVMINGNTATVVGGGDTDITADWEAFAITQHCFLSAEGECIDGTCSSNRVPTIGDILASILIRDLHFARVSYAGLSTAFEPGPFTDEATLHIVNAIDGSRVCSGGEFTVTINFTFPPGGTIRDRNDPLNIVKTGANHQFQWLAWDFIDIDSSGGRGSMSIRLFRENHTAAADYVDFTITGKNPPGTVGGFNGKGRVHLVCQ